MWNINARCTVAIRHFLFFFLILSGFIWPFCSSYIIIYSLYFDWLSQTTTCVYQNEWTTVPRDNGTVRIIVLRPHQANSCYFSSNHPVPFTSKEMSNYNLFTQKISKELIAISEGKIDWLLLIKIRIAWVAGVNELGIGRQGWGLLRLWSWQ